MTIYTKLKGQDINKVPQEVTAEDLIYLESLRINGGPNTKRLLEEFGREKLGVEIMKNFKVNRILDEALIPLVKDRIAGVVTPDKDPIESVVTAENMELDSKSIASDMPSIDVPFINMPILKLEEVVKSSHLKHVGNSNVKATGNIFAWTEALSVLDTLKPCTKEGVLI